jgi:hypothetical protein
MRSVYLLYGADGFEAPYSSLAKAKAAVRADGTGWTQVDPMTWAMPDRSGGAGLLWTIQKWAVQ